VKKKEFVIDEENMDGLLSTAVLAMLLFDDRKKRMQKLTKRPHQNYLLLFL